MPATGWSQARAAAFLASEAAAHPWVQLHTGHPGAAGTANIATETDRLQVTWGSVTLAGDGQSVEIDWTSDIEWTSVAGSEDYTYVTGWSLVTAGVFGWSGQLTADAVVIGNDFRIPAGAYILRQPIAFT
jgi:acetyltransferase-like isoleucine patch superfamily enzyme